MYLRERSIAFNAFLGNIDSIKVVFLSACVFVQIRVVVERKSRLTQTTQKKQESNKTTFFSVTSDNVKSLIFGPFPRYVSWLVQTKDRFDTAISTRIPYILSQQGFILGESSQMPLMCRCLRVFSRNQGMLFRISSIVYYEDNEERKDP